MVESIAKESRVRSERKNEMYRILICEDDPVILSAMSSYLSSWGYEVRCVKNFKDVMTEFGEFAPELVLLDISLPFFNGYHWCSQIRSISNSGIDGILPAINYSRNPSVLCFSVDYKAFEALFHA